MSYIRKTRDIYVIIGHYQTGEEVVSYEENRKDLKENLRLYRENVKGIAFSYRKIRERI